MENTFLFSLPTIVWIVINILILFVVCRSSETHVFTKVLLITALTLFVISLIFHLLAYTLQIEGFANYSIIIGRFNMLGSVLNVMGLIQLLGSSKTASPGAGTPAINAVRKNLAITGLLTVITFGIYLIFWLYKFVKELKENYNEDVKVTPGRVIGFLFIPLFNCYWIFYILFGIPYKLRQIEKKYYPTAVGFHFHPLVMGCIYVILMILNIANAFNMEGRQTVLDSVISTVVSILIACAFWLTMQAKWNAMIDYSKKQGTIV